MEIYDVDHLYNEEVYNLFDQIIDICDRHRIPLVACFQVGHKTFYNTKLLYAGRTDERLYLGSRVLENGDPRFVTVIDRSQQEFQTLVDKHNTFLKTVLEKLEEHDKQYQQYKEPAGLCRFDFAQLRKLIENEIQLQHLPPGE